jgi:hypothetical protein
MDLLNLIKLLEPYTASINIAIGGGVPLNWIIDLAIKEGPKVLEVAQDIITAWKTRPKAAACCDEDVCPADAAVKAAYDSYVATVALAYVYHDATEPA